MTDLSQLTANTRMYELFSELKNERRRLTWDEVVLILHCRDRLASLLVSGKL